MIPRHLVVAISSWGSRIVSAGAQLLAARLLLQSLKVENYAIFALLTGLQGWFLLVDFGVGFSVQNLLSQRRAKAESTCSVLLAGRLLAMVFFVLTIVLLYFGSPWLASVLMKAYPALDEAQRTRLFFISGVLCIGYGIGTVVYKIWYAEQRGYLSNAVSALGSILGLCGLAVAVRVPESDRLLACILAFVGPSAVLPLGVLTVQLVKSGHSHPSGDKTDSIQLRAVLKQAFGFWIFALLAAATLQVDYIVISQLLAPREVALYNLATKIFSLAFFLYNAVLMAIWPIIAELVVQKRWPEVSGYICKCLAVGLSFNAGCNLVLILTMPWLMKLLAPGQNLEASLWLLAVMGVYQLVRVWTDTFSMLLQAMNHLKPLWVLVPVQAVLSCVFQWGFAKCLGLVGIVLGLMASFLLTVSWGFPLAVQFYRRKDVVVSPPLARKAQ